MDADENELSSGSIDAGKDVPSSHVCKVCGCNDAHMYLGIQCCASCKMFFHRNADFDLVNYRFIYVKDYFLSGCV